MGVGGGGSGRVERVEVQEQVCTDASDGTAWRSDQWGHQRCRMDDGAGGAGESMMPCEVVRSIDK